MKKFDLFDFKMIRLYTLITQSFCNVPTSNPIFFFCLTNHHSINLSKKIFFCFHSAMTLSSIKIPYIKMENNAFLEHSMSHAIDSIFTVVFMFQLNNELFNFPFNMWDFSQPNDSIMKELCFLSNHKP
jgi:hypothetical protein